MHVCTSDHDADPYGRGQSKLDWRTILTTHDRWLRTVVFWRLRDHQAVDDVMQEVALAAVRQASPISDVTRVAPWLYRLAVRAVLLHRRSQGRRRRMMERFESLGANGKPCEPEPLDWLLSHERQAAVRKAMDRLPARDAEILLLKYTENWSYHQIAAHLGVGHSAVEARLHRARARLRSELGATDMVEVRS
jgi:RNA polymerase sigma-70 factor (ECF subfamily)